MTRPFRSAIIAIGTLLSSAGSIFISAYHASGASHLDRRQRGAIVFQDKGCERCHAILGTGGDRAPDLSTVGQSKTTIQIRTQVVKGGHGMPPFEKVLSKDEVRDVVFFLSSCKSQAAPGCREWMQQPETKAKTE